jgi:hypothetical protein
MTGVVRRAAQGQDNKARRVVGIRKGFQDGYPTMKDNRLVYVTIILAVVALAPLMAVNSELWDTVIAEMALITGDHSLIRDWLLRQGWYMKYYTYVVVELLGSLTGLPPKTFINAATVLSILGIARETFKLLIGRFGLTQEAAWLGSCVVIAFPVWHTLVSSAVFINIFCLWLFMIGVGLWGRNKLLALVFLIPSFQLFSLFAFAVGFIVSDFILTVEKENYKRKTWIGFLLSLCLVIAFAALSAVINVHGKDGSYNTFNLERVQSFVGFAILAMVTLALTYFMRRGIHDPRERQRFVRHMLSFLALSFFAGLAYWAVGRPLRFFNFGSFTARHTYLTCIPFAVLVAVIGQYLSSRMSRKVFIGMIAVFLTALVVILHQGYSHKVAAVIFKDMLSESFSKIEAPPSGYVVIEVRGAKPPRHVHEYEINMCLFKAYGRSAWMANGFWNRNMDLGPEAMKGFYDMSSEDRRKLLCSDVTGNAYTRYAFTLTGYHQEGRFWYWWYHLISDYSAFNPQLRKLAAAE